MIGTAHCSSALLQHHIPGCQASYDQDCAVWAAHAWHKRACKLELPCSSRAGPQCMSTAASKLLWTLLPQTFEMPASACIGQYLRINLHGKRQRQESDGLFYTAICVVTAHGRAAPLPLPALAPWRLHALPRLHLDSVRMPMLACSRPALLTDGRVLDAWQRHG